MTVHPGQWSIRLVLAALVACLLAFASSGGQVSAGAPNPCTLLTDLEATTALEAPLDGEPFFGEIFDLGACVWTDNDGDVMGLRWSNTSEEDAAFLYDNTIAPLSEDIAGLGDRAKWVSQVELIPFIWFELRVQLGRHYLSLEIDKTEELVPCTLGCPQFKQVDNTEKMLETMAIILQKLEPRPAVEFTQAIQELQTYYELGSFITATGGPPVPIIAGKPAVVRVYFNDVVEAGQRTVELSGVASESATVSVSPNCSVEMQRKKTSGCQSADLYFTPPSGQWTADFTVKNDDGEQIDEFGFKIVSVDSPGLDVTYLPVCVSLTEGAEPTCPSSSVGGQAVTDPTKRIFPVAPSGFSYRRLPVPPLEREEPVSLGKSFGFLLDLKWIWEAQAMGPMPIGGDQLVGWVPSGSAELAGQSELASEAISGVATITRVVWVREGSTSEAQFFLLHELGHNLGLRHTNQPDGCGAVDPGTDWPYLDSTIQEVGFDVGAKKVKPEGSLSVMTYCTPPENAWISPHNYRQLAEGGLQPPGIAQPSGGTAKQLIVRGTAQADGSAGTIDSSYVIDSMLPAAQPNPLGNHCLYLTGGAQLDYCFDLSFTDHQTLAPLEEQGFVLRLTLPPGTTNAYLMHGSDELDSLELSPSAPTVEITEPQPGAEWSGEQTVRWSVEDEDGGPVHVAVLYSPDGGVNWLAMDVGNDDGEFTFDTRDLTGDEIMVRVLASDGLNTTQEDVGPIALANGEPRAFGDNDCDGDVDAVDGLKGLQNVAGIPYSQNDPCTPLGESVGVSPAGATERPWGDVDCDGDVDAADGLSILRFVAGLPVNQGQACPPIGSEVLVG